jgi:cob(I)alamin adenosyltransferase
LQSTKGPEQGGLGLVHVYTGEAKGKTTAAIGLALRAAESGFRVAIIQFMKALSEESAEITAIKRFENVIVARFGGNLLAKDHPPIEDIKIEIAKGLKAAKHLVENDLCDVLIMDEINVAVSMELAGIVTVLEVASLCKGKVELVMTGRNAPQEFIDIADYASACTVIKHPFERGIPARRGIEF